MVVCITVWLVCTVRCDCNTLFVEQVQVNILSMEKKERRMGGRTELW